jgi:hypothetical protein
MPGHKANKAKIASNKNNDLQAKTWGPVKRQQKGSDKICHLETQIVTKKITTHKKTNLKFPCPRF